MNGQRSAVVILLGRKPSSTSVLECMVAARAESGNSDCVCSKLGMIAVLKKYRDILENSWFITDAKIDDESIVQDLSMRTHNRTH